MRQNHLWKVCMAALFSFVFLLANVPAASAASMSDLQGQYRLVNSPPDGTYTTKSRGSIVTFGYEGDDLVGRMTKASPTSTFRDGDVVFTNMYVDNGELHATIIFGDYDQSVVVIRVFEDGRFLRVEGDKRSGNDQDLFWDMRKI